MPPLPNSLIPEFKNYLSLLFNLFILKHIVLNPAHCVLKDGMTLKFSSSFLHLHSSGISGVHRHGQVWQCVVKGRTLCMPGKLLQCSQSLYLLFLVRSLVNPLFAPWEQRNHNLWAMEPFKEQDVT